VPRSKDREGSGEAQAGPKARKDVAKAIDDAIFSAPTIINMSIYAILELPHELYFGSHSEKGLNVLEKVRIKIEEKPVEKPVEAVKGYYSPTKQRGIERRAIAYSIVNAGGMLVPYYKYFNLSIDVTDVYGDGVPDPRDILTFLWGATWRNPPTYIRGRVGYGGGVAVQDDVSIRQRIRVPYDIYTVTEKESRYEVAEQTLWRKEYIEPGVLIPVIRHGFLLGWENYEPHALAYAFLKGLSMAGAGTPKGLGIFEAYWRDDNIKEKVVVVDLYTGLAPEPVTISPFITSVIEALEEFKGKAYKPDKNKIKESFDQKELDNIRESIKGGGYVRFVGDAAYSLLRALAEEFSQRYLGKIECLGIPRVKALEGYYKGRAGAPGCGSGQAEALQG